MQVTLNVANPLQREQTMTKGEDRAKIIAIKELLERDEASSRPRSKLR